MRNSVIYILLFFLLNVTGVHCENILIQAKNITLEKDRELSIFRNEVTIKTEDGNLIKSDYAEYNKKKGIIVLKNNIIATDTRDNQIETEYAEYFEKDKIFKSSGPTKIITSEKYIIDGKNIIFDNINKYINSKDETLVTDLDNNKIFLENFEYQINDNIFKSLGYVKIKDQLNNSYEFSQIYIDTKEKEMLGTDIKAFMNHEDFKIDKRNKPRIFANAFKMSNKRSSFSKSIFTLCNYRENDKCPPWSIQASEMLHDSKKKTIYYDNAVIKVYDIPIFYLPRLSHPDPTVDRRSGFLPPSLSDSKNLGAGVSIPYFWAVKNDKNFTVTSKFYYNENPLFMGEYHQAFENSNLIADFGYTKGYENVTSKKQAGDKSHFFGKFTTNFSDDSSANSSLDIKMQNVSHQKYLKLYKVESNLVDYNIDTLENSLDFSHEDDQIFLGLNASVYETLKDDYNDKYEYILPEVTVDKNLFSSNTFGSLDLQSNFRVHTYDTNKSSTFFVNNFDWESKELNYKSGLKTNFLGNLKNINYETRNLDLYKTNSTSELFGAIGYLSEINLQKDLRNSQHLLTPKAFLRYAPGSMRKENSGKRLDPINAFTMDRLNSTNNFETGLSSAIGVDYKIKKGDRNFDFSLAQVINEKENKKMPTQSSLDEKLSDLVGSLTHNLNDNIDFKFNFAVDQNYNEVNYSEIGTSLNFNPLKIDFNYLEENKHIGDQEYFKTKIDFANSNNGLFSFETKRNLVTDSSEFYNLSYEYLNDCLRAGLVYRREFYTDSELEPENSLMFKITLIPFGNINSPSLSE